METTEEKNPVTRYMPLGGCAQHLKVLLLVTLALLMSSCCSIMEMNDKTPVSRIGDNSEEISETDADIGTVDHYTKLGSYTFAGDSFFRDEYFVLTKFDAEPDGYKLYTYVLLPHWGELPDEASTARYSAILAAINNTTRPHMEAEESPPDHQITNLFITFDPWGNSRLEKKYIDLITHFFVNEKKIVQPLETQIGPFLVSVSIPLSRLERVQKNLQRLTDETNRLKNLLSTRSSLSYGGLERFNALNRQYMNSRYDLAELARKSMTMLFVNLSDTHPAAMKEVVATYKNFVAKDIPTTGPARLSEVPGFTASNRSSISDEITTAPHTPFILKTTKTNLITFDPLKLRLLNFVLKADENVRLVRSAVAGWATVGKAAAEPKN